MKNNYSSLVTGIVLVSLLTLLSDPFMLWMPEPAQMMVLLCVVILAIVWAGFVMRERAHDERDSLHSLHAGRVSYLSGLFVLTLALLVQGLSDAIDIWIVASLGVMVVAKIIARWYLDRNC